MAIHALEADSVIRVQILIGAGRAFPCQPGLWRKGRALRRRRGAHELDAVAALQRFNGLVIGARVAAAGGFAHYVGAPDQLRPRAEATARRMLARVPEALSFIDLGELAVRAWRGQTMAMHAGSLAATRFPALSYPNT